MNETKEGPSQIFPDDKAALEAFNQLTALSGDKAVTQAQNIREYFHGRWPLDKLPDGKTVGEVRKQMSDFLDQVSKQKEVATTATGSSPTIADDFTDFANLINPADYEGGAAPANPNAKFPERPVEAQQTSSAELAEKDRQIVALTQERDNWKNQAEEVGSRLADLQNQLTNLQTQFEELKNRQTADRKELEEARRRVSELESDNINLKTAKDKAEGDLKAMADQKDSYRQKLESSDDDLAEVLRESDALDTLFIRLTGKNVKEYAQYLLDQNKASKESVGAGNDERDEFELGDFGDEPSFPEDEIFLPPESPTTPEPKAPPSQGILGRLRNAVRSRDEEKVGSHVLRPEIERKVARENVRDIEQSTADTKERRERVRYLRDQASRKGNTDAVIFYNSVLQKYKETYDSPKQAETPKTLTSPDIHKAGGEPTKTFAKTEIMRAPSTPKKPAPVPEKDDEVIDVEPIEETTDETATAEAAEQETQRIWEANKKRIAEILGKDVSEIDGQFYVSTDEVRAVVKEVMASSIKNRDSVEDFAGSVLIELNMPIVAKSKDPKDLELQQEFIDAYNFLNQAKKE